MDIKQFNIIMQDEASGPFMIQIPLHTMSVYVVPRAYVTKARTLDGIYRHGIYILHGNGKVYVGQTQNGLTRIEQHLLKKDWWERAILFLADSMQFDLDMISGLERTGIERALTNSPYEVENKDMPRYEAKSLYNKKITSSCYDDIEYVLNFLGVRTERNADEIAAVEKNESPMDLSDFISFYDRESFTGENVDAYSFNGECKPVKNLTAAFTEILGHLYDMDPEKLEDPRFERWIGEDRNDLKVPSSSITMVKEFRPGKFLNTSKSNQEKVNMLKKLFRLYAVPKDLFLIHLVPSDDDDDDVSDDAGTVDTNLPIFPSTED